MMLNYRTLMGWVIAILIAMTRPSVAQQRYNGTWNKISVPGSSFISDFNFKDSLFGLARFYTPDSIVSTSDGGHTWVSDTSTGNQPVNKLYLNSMECWGFQSGIFFGGGPGEVTDVLSSGSIIMVTPPAGGDNGIGAYLPIAEHMIDSADGYRLVQEQDEQLQLVDTVIFLATHNSWQTSVTYGSPYAWSGPQDPNITSNNFFSGIVIDSSETWTADINTILHTTTAGETWDSILPIDTTRYKPQWKDFFIDTVTNEVYAEAQYSIVDFAYSSDYGQTWRLDSTFGQKLWRMAVPAPGIIWAMLGNGGKTGNIGIAPIEVSPPTNFQPAELSNKVAYSIDTGKTWYIDSNTFAGDTLLEMHFIDARHGWIAGYANGSSHIWYYDADASIVTTSVQSGTSGANSPYLLVYPDPAQTTITITGATLANGSTLALTVFDPLGRRYFCPQENAILDIASLPSGIYFVNDGYVSGKFVKE
jgi:hypothetical protein